ncbi:MAG: pilus assembly protein PilM [Candidatus Omnitrophota bacterium]
MRLLKGLFKKDYIVGLDIGSSAVKAAIFSDSEGGPCLIGVELKEIAKHDDPESAEKETIAAIRYLTRGIDVRKSRIIVNVNCPNTAIKKITTPCIPKSELREGITLQAKNYFPFPIDKAILDFEITGDFMDKGVRKYEIVLAACPIDTANRYTSLLQKAGIKPLGLISSAYALHKAQENLPVRAGESNCVIDIGETHTELVISSGKQLVFTRKLPVCAKDFTKAMTGALVSDRGRIQLTFDEAERIKREVGIPAESETRIVEGKISTTQISAMLREPLERLAGEIGRCLDYYREEGPGGGAISSVVLFGGGACLGGMNKALAEALGIEVGFGDSFSGLKAEKKVLESRAILSHRLELAVGAVLSGTRGINLLPPEIKDEKKNLVRRGVLEAVGTAIILASVFLYTGMRIQLGNLEKRISSATLELASLKPQLNRAQTAFLTGKILADEPQWEDVFVDLSNVIPDNIFMTSLSMKNDVITLRGIVNSQYGEEAISDFILMLEKGIFNNVKLVNTKRLEGNNETEFELNCWVDYEKS